MIVGFLRNKSTPPRLARLLSYTCEYNGIKLVYITPKNIEVGKKTISGLMFINGKWEQVETPLPKYIDINPHLFNKPEFKRKINYLKKNTKLSIEQRNVIKKDDLQTMLMKDMHMSRYSIPSKNIKSFKDLFSFLNKYQHIVVKPVGGLQGKSVMVVEQIKEGKYSIGLGKEKKYYNKQDFEKYCLDHIIDSNYMVQKYVSSRTKQGDPFDCRVHLEKGQNNDWVVANMFIRIGIGQSVVSNISQGGGISKPLPFFEYNFDGNPKEIYNNISHMALLLAKKIESNLNKSFMTMGLDVGILPNGDLCVFEINSFPIVSPQMAEITLLRAQHYKYMLENLKYKSSKAFISKENINQKRLSLLSREIKDLKESTSWKVTKPLRIIGSKIKGKK